MANVEIMEFEHDTRFLFICIWFLPLVRLGLWNSIYSRHIQCCHVIVFNLERYRISLQFILLWGCLIHLVHVTILHALNRHWDTLGGKLYSICTLTHNISSNSLLAIYRIVEKLLNLLTGTTETSMMITFWV